MYELTMAQGYFMNGRQNERAAFDYFFRENPFDGGYVVFAGLNDLLEILSTISFDDEDIEYLRSKGFKEEFLNYLKNFSIKADIHGMREGEIVFPYEPILRIEGNLIETQIIETLILNILNFESLIATKAARIRQVAGDRLFIDFGLRRAQGLGGIHASKAAVIGGANATSNVYSGFMYDLDISGTQAHSWIQSFDDELTAFRKFAEVFPDQCILLVDTYDTLKSGIPNAITVAKELKDKGHKMVGIRLDSGDLAYLSKKTRKMLDDEGLEDVQIVASNQLDEYVIRSLAEQDAPIDAFGIGTKLITGKPTAALDGVYKLSMAGGKPRLKISENITKVSLPGLKKAVRLIDAKGFYEGDGILLDDEKSADRIYHPFEPDKFTGISKFQKIDLFQPLMKQGEIVGSTESTEEISNYVRSRLDHLPEEHKRFENPHTYKVGISKKLMDLRDDIVQDIKDAM